MMVSPKIRLGNKEPAVAGGLRAALTSCAFALCLTGWIVASEESAIAQTACAQDPSWGAPPSAPIDVCGRGESVSRDFYALSWQIFKFLVWPAASGQRGVPDTTRKITNMHGQRTFETLKTDWEVFLPNADQPVAWSDYPNVAGPCSNHPNIKPGALVLASFSEFGNLKEGEPALSHVLVAQNRTYVRYQAAYNKDVFDTILNNRLHNAAIVGAIRAPQPDMPVPDAAKQPDGALTVKSAWIELPSKKKTLQKYIDPSRFYVRHDAWLQDPQTGACRIARVGLVGLHLVYKTPSRPQWIWSTFEHVDNVPEPPPHPGRNYAFNSGKFGAHMSSAPEPDFRIPTPAGSSGPGVPPRAYQVERLQQIDPQAMDANRAQQKELESLGSVWRYYKLVMTQWPSTPSAPNGDAGSVGPRPVCGEQNGTATVNTTMETFFQTQQQSCELRLTCMGCHDMARATDFVWSIPLNQYQPPDMAGREPRAVAIRALQDFLQRLRTQ
jgi:hypothetical protein